MASIGQRYAPSNWYDDMMIITDIVDPPAFKDIAHIEFFKHLIFVNLCIYVFYIWMSYLISLNSMLFKNIAHVGTLISEVF